VGLSEAAYFPLQDFELVAPIWTMQESPLYYEIQAIAEGSEPLTLARALELLQVVLADRFQLKFHKETRELPAYAITVGREGPKFTGIKSPRCVGQKQPMFGVHSGPFHDTSVEGRHGSLTVCDPISITFLARMLTLYLDRPVIDRTGLTGSYVFELKWDNRSSLFSEMRNRLGLQVIARNEPVEVMVIDRVERPSATPGQ